MGRGVPSTQEKTSPEALKTGPRLYWGYVAELGPTPPVSLTTSIPPLSATVLFNILLIFTIGRYYYLHFMKRKLTSEKLIDLLKVI